MNDDQKIKQAKKDWIRIKKGANKKKMEEMEEMIYPPANPTLRKKRIVFIQCVTEIKRKHIEPRNNK